MSSQSGFTEKENAPREMHTRTTVRPEMAGSSEESWKRSVIAFLATLIVAVSSIATMNYVVNPLGTFGTHLFPAMVWNGREEKVTALAHEDPKPKAIILGSSHVWAIAPAQVTALTGLPSFNAGVSVGTAEDYYSLLRYAVEKAGARPELVIIGVDIETVHNGKPVDPRTQEVAELREYLPRTGFKERMSRWKPLETMQSTKLSLRSIRLAMRGKAATPPSKIYNVGAHGDTHLTALVNGIASGQTTRDKELQFNIPLYRKRWENFTALSKVRMDYLQKTLEYCQQRNIRMVVFVTPLHPALQAGLADRGYKEKRDDLIRRLTQMTGATGAAFVNYADVTSFGGSPEAFMDGSHLDEKTGQLLTVRLLKDSHVIQ